MSGDQADTGSPTARHPSRGFGGRPGAGTWHGRPPRACLPRPAVRVDRPDQGGRGQPGQPPDRGRLLRERGVSLEGRVGLPGTALTVSDRGPAGLAWRSGSSTSERASSTSGSGAGQLRRPAPAAAGPRGSAGVAGRTRTGRLAEAAGHGLEPADLAIAVPVLVAKAGIVVLAPNLGCRDVDVAAEPRPLLPEPLRGLLVEVDNEANLGALTECGTCGRRDFVHVSAGAGIGGALVAEGKLLRVAVASRANSDICRPPRRGSLHMRLPWMPGECAGEEALLRTWVWTTREATASPCCGAAAAGRPTCRCPGGRGPALGIALSGR